MKKWQKILTIALPTSLLVAIPIVVASCSTKSEAQKEFEKTYKEYLSWLDKLASKMPALKEAFSTLKEEINKQINKSEKLYDEAYKALTASLKVSIDGMKKTLGQN